MCGWYAWRCRFVKLKFSKGAYGLDVDAAPSLGGGVRGPSKPVLAGWLRAAACRHVGDGEDVFEAGLTSVQLFEVLGKLRTGWEKGAERLKRVREA